MSNQAERILASRYATAFVNLYMDELNPEVAEHMAAIAAFFRTHHKVLFFLSLPSLADEVKRRALYTLCGTVPCQAACKRIMDLLIAHKRAQLIGLVFQAVTDVYYERAGIMPFVIESMPALDEQALQAVQRFLADKTKQHIIYRYTVNPALIAGLRAQSATCLWEQSVAERLRHLRSVDYQ